MSIRRRDARSSYVLYSIGSTQNCCQAVDFVVYRSTGGLRAGDVVEWTEKKYWSEYPSCVTASGSLIVRLARGGGHVGP